MPDIDHGRPQVGYFDDHPTRDAYCEVEPDNNDDCVECRRLDKQARVAALTYDKSRLADIRIMRGRHLLEEHPEEND